MRDECDYNHEGFCEVYLEDKVVCPCMKLDKEGATGLPVCTAKPEDLIEVYEECETCTGPDSKDPEDGPPCECYNWETCEHPEFWKREATQP